MGVTLRNISFNGKMIGKDFIPKPPIASFTASPVMGTIPFTVQFTDTSTLAPTSWLWDFKNDGTATSTEQNPTYTYTDAGTYSVKLTASNSGGSNSTTSVNLITANPQYPDQTASGTNINSIPGRLIPADSNSLYGSANNNFPMTMDANSFSNSAWGSANNNFPMTMDANSFSNTGYGSANNNFPMIMDANSFSNSAYGSADNNFPMTIDSAH